MGDSDRPPCGTLDDYGWTPDVADRLGRLPAEGAPGRVVRTDWGAVLVVTRQGLLHVDVPVGMDPAPVTGDWLVLAGQPPGLACVAPRTAALVRRDASSSQSRSARSRRPPPRG